MGRRSRLLSQAIVRAIITEPESTKQSIITRILAFFHVLNIQLERYRPDLFLKLRSEIWEIDEKDYRDAFNEVDREESLEPAGDLGFSGSVSHPLSYVKPSSSF
jgi:hypothetical protein